PALEVGRGRDRSAGARVRQLRPGRYGVRPAAPERLARIHAAISQVRMITIDEVCYVRAIHEYSSVFTRDLSGRIELRLKSNPETLAVSRAHAHRFRRM